MISTWVDASGIMIQKAARQAQPCCCLGLPTLRFDRELRSHSPDPRLHLVH